MIPSFNIEKTPNGKWYNKSCTLKKDNVEIGSCHYYGKFMTFVLKILCVKMTKVQDANNPQKIYRLNKKEFDNLLASSGLFKKTGISPDLKTFKQPASKEWTVEELMQDNSIDPHEVYEFAIEHANKQDKWLLMQRAAKLGHDEAMREVGQMYRYGEPVYLHLEQNINTAIEWLTKAANMGNQRAKQDLGNIYWNGEGALAQNKELAKKYFTEALKAGKPITIHNKGVSLIVTKAWQIPE